MLFRSGPGAGCWAWRPVAKARNGSQIVGGSGRFMSAGGFDGPGDVLAAVAQRERGAFDGDELELVVLVVEGGGEAGADLEGSPGDEEAGFAADDDGAGRGDLGGDGLKGLARRRGRGAVKVFSRSPAISCSTSSCSR